jgi:WD40 repeat protein
VWDLDTGQELLTLRGHVDFVTACVVLPDGKRAISGSGDRTLKMWDLITGEELLTLHGHTAQVSACMVTPDGRRAVSASEDHTVKVWDLQSGRCVDTVYGVAPYDCVCVAEERICAGDRVGNVWMLVSTAVKEEPVSLDPPSLRSLRRLLEAVLGDAGELDAFCQHHFPLTHKLFSPDMTLHHRIDALLTADAMDILSRLRQSYPEAFAQHAHLLSAE